MEKSPNWIYSQKNREYPMPEIYGTIIKTKLYIDIYKLEIMYSSTDSPPSTRQDWWLIESKCSPKKAPSEWTMLTARATMLISMETKWTCTPFRLFKPRLRLSFVSVTKCMKTLQMASLYVKLCKTQLFQQFTSQWRIVSSKNQITLNFCTKLLFLSLLTNPKICDSSFWNLQ